MKTTHLSNSFLLIIMFGVCTISVAQSGKEKGGNRKMGMNAAKSPLTIANVEQRLKKVTLTEKQKRTLVPLVARFRAALAQSRKEFETAVPKALRKARGDLSKKLEAQGMKGDKLREALSRAVKMTAAQTAALEKLQNSTKELNDQLRKAAGPIFDAKQQTTLGLLMADKPGTASKTQSPLTLNNFIKRFGKITLTAEQKKTLGPPVNRLRADLAQTQKEFETAVPVRLRNARAAASKKFEARGMKGNKLRKAISQDVKLTAAQSVALKKYREKKKQLDDDFRKACLTGLDPDQRKAVGL